MSKKGQKQIRVCDKRTKQHSILFKSTDVQRFKRNAKRCILKKVIIFNGNIFKDIHHTQLHNQGANHLISAGAQHE